MKALCHAGAGVALSVVACLAADPVPIIDSDERVVLFASPAWVAENGDWECEIRGWIFETQWYSDAVGPLAAALGLDKDAAADPLFRDRARWFVVDNESEKRVAVRTCGKTVVSAASGKNGHFVAQLTLPPAEARAAAGDSRCAVVDVVVGEGRTDRFTADLHLVEPQGISVISDIDDTIKISEVRDRKALLRNTFLKPYRAVPGMAEVYAHWSGAKQAAFHYVSASPWQLYVPLDSFRKDAGFPGGSLHLKQFRWKDESVMNLFESSETYKPPVIEAILARYPNRRFVLIGDSGEKDPEVYAAIARRRGAQVVRILIRDVTDEAPDAERYREVFAGLSPDLWKVFRDPKDVRDMLP